MAKRKGPRRSGQGNRSRSKSVAGSTRAAKAAKRGSHPRPFPSARKSKRPKTRAKPTRRRRPHASMQFFSAGETVRANVSRRSARIIGSYLAAVRRLLDANDTEPLEQFIGKSVKDARGNVFPLETRPNVLYRLNAAVEPFEEVYRLLA